MTIKSYTDCDGDTIETFKTVKGNKVRILVKVNGKKSHVINYTK